MKCEIYWKKLMLCSMISELENSKKKKEKKKVVNRDLQSRKWYQTGCAEFQLCSRPNSHTVYPHFHISFYSNILSVYIKQLWKKLHFQWVILNKTSSSHSLRVIKSYCSHRGTSRGACGTASVSNGAHQVLCSKEKLSNVVYSHTPCCLPVNFLLRLG